MLRNRLYVREQAHHRVELTDGPYDHTIVITTTVTRYSAAGDLIDALDCEVEVDHKTAAIHVTGPERLTVEEREALARRADAQIWLEARFAECEPDALYDFVDDGITMEDGALCGPICEAEYQALAILWEGADPGPRLSFIVELYTRGWCMRSGDRWVLTPAGRAQISEPAYRCHACKTWDTCDHHHALLAQCPRCNRPVEVLYIPDPAERVEEVARG